MRLMKPKTATACFSRIGSEERPRIAKWRLAYSNRPSSHLGPQRHRPVRGFCRLAARTSSIFDESTRTWTTLRHLGFSNRQFVLSAGLEGAGIALAALICGAIAGLAMGWLLIFVINVQSFGWTLLWRIPYLDFLRFGVLLILIGFASGCASAFYWNLKNR